MKPVPRVIGHASFFRTSADGTHLFDVRKGVNLDDALNALFCVLDVAQTLTSLAAHELDGDGINGGTPDSRIVFAANYLVDMSRAIAAAALEAKG